MIDDTSAATFILRENEALRAQIARLEEGLQTQRERADIAERALKKQIKSSQKALEKVTIEAEEMGQRYRAEEYRASNASKCQICGGKLYCHQTHLK